jgi:hypothetical protein
MRVLALVVCVSFLAAPVRAWQSQPSLGELAEKEKQRRAAAAKKGKKVYTEDDLKRAGGKSASFPEGSSATETASAQPGETKAEGQPAAADAKPPKTDAELRAERRTELQGKMDAQVKRRGELQKRVDDIQRSLSDPTHNPYGAAHGDNTKLLEDNKQELAKTDQAIADLEDQARRLGISLNR